MEQSECTEAITSQIDSDDEVTATTAIHETSEVDSKNLSETASIPAAMLTPPSTCEPIPDFAERTPLDVAASLRSNSASDDDGNVINDEHSNHSTNSDSTESNLLYINEGSVDSTDISNTADRVNTRRTSATQPTGLINLLESSGIDLNDEKLLRMQCVVRMERVDEVAPTEDVAQNDGQNSDSAVEQTNEVAMETAPLPETSVKNDACDSSVDCSQGDNVENSEENQEIVALAQESDTKSEAIEKLSNEIDTDVIKTWTRCSSSPIDIRGDEVDVNGMATSSPSQLLNGAAASQEEHTVPSPSSVEQNPSADDIIEHRKLKRRLSDPASDCEIVQKQSKTNNNQIADDIVNEAAPSEAASVDAMCDSLDEIRNDNCDQFTANPEGSCHTEAAEDDIALDKSNESNEPYDSETNANSFESAGHEESSADGPATPATPVEPSTECDSPPPHGILASPTLHKHMNGHDSLEAENFSSSIDEAPLTDSPPDQSHSAANAATEELISQQLARLQSDNEIEGDGLLATFTDLEKSPASKLNQPMVDSVQPEPVSVSSDLSDKSEEENDDDDDDDDDDESSSRNTSNCNDSVNTISNNDSDSTRNPNDIMSNNTNSSNQISNASGTLNQPQEEPPVISYNSNSNSNSSSSNNNNDNDNSNNNNNNNYNINNNNSNNNNNKNNTVNGKSMLATTLRPASDAQSPKQSTDANIHSAVQQRSKVQIDQSQQQSLNNGNNNQFNAHIRIRRQVFLCSACGIYYEKWNLFYHIREVHNKFICLFCLGIFSNAERLVNHLESKHISKPNVYEHKDDLLRSLRDQCFLMCCVCEHIFSEEDDFTGHSCENFMKPCTVCGLKFIHKSNCSTLQTNKGSKHKHKKSGNILSLPPMQQQHTQQQLHQQPHCMIPSQPVAPLAPEYDSSKAFNHLPAQNSTPTSLTLLRSALMGTTNSKDQRPNHFNDYQNFGAPAQKPIFTPQQMAMNFAPQQQQGFSQMRSHDESVHKRFVDSQAIAAQSQYDAHPFTHSAVDDAHIMQQYGRAPPNQFGANNNFELNQFHASKVPPLPTTAAAQTNEKPNSDSSSDSDDSNSDSSSDQSDAENDATTADNKENDSHRVVKPFRLSLIDPKNNIARITPNTTPMQQWQPVANPGKNINNMREREEEPASKEYHSFGDDANEDDDQDNSFDGRTSREDSTSAYLNGMQYQKHSSSNENIDAPQTPLLVPKLKLKLTKEFQTPIESEQSSTESDDEDEEDEDDDGDNEQDEISVTDDNPPDSYEKQQQLQSEQLQAQQQFIQRSESMATDSVQYPFGASNVLEPAATYHSEVDDSEPSAKNTSIESNDKQSEEIDVLQHSDEPLQLFGGVSEQGLLEMHQIQSREASFQPPTLLDDELLQSGSTETANINEILQNENMMTPPDSISGENQQQQHPIDVGNELSALAPDAIATDSQHQEAIESIEPEPVEDVRPITEFILDQPLDKIPIKSFIRKCLESSYLYCLYCNHARSIAVNGASLAQHLIDNHRFSATVDSITAEELLPVTCEQKITAGLEELEGTYFNLATYDYKNEDPDYRYVKHFECFQCRFYSPIYKDLYLHNRKMHLRSALICLMCRSNFYSYSELVCHMCPGAQTKLIPIDLKFRCVLCNLDDIPSAFRLMVHLRKKHSACDVCLEECSDQSKLSCHVWKHKLHHLCYRCNITYRNKADITRHLFWKHGTESVLCKRCLEKKWPHVYHFCVPPTSFTCEICASTFSRAVALKVHKRIHNTDSITYPCGLEGCEKKFISRKLTINHWARHYMPELPPPSEEAAYAKLNEISDAIDGEVQRASRSNTPKGSPRRIASPKLIEQEAPIDAVISVIEHDARLEKEEEKLTKVAEAAAGSGEPSQKSRKKLKKNRADFSDLLDLPSVNLSESDSSEESDAESNAPMSLSAENSRHSMTLAPTESIDKEKLAETVQPAEEDEENKAPLLDADIWANFKTYQASQMQDKAVVDIEDDRLFAEKPILLHVSQSDHDYPMMYKPLLKKQKSTSVEQTSVTPIIEENSDGTIKVSFLETHITTTSSGGGEQSPRDSLLTITEEEIPKVEHDEVKVACDGDKEAKADRKAKESDSSSDSSDSDSSCSCGSNCSCSSSSSSSCSSSSDSDSDSSSSESKRKQKQKVLTKTRKSSESKADRKTVDEAKSTSKPKSPSPALKLEEPPAADTKPETETQQPMQEAVGDNSAKDDTNEIIDVIKMESDVVDVVTTDKIKIDRPDPDSIILESDLDTTESETDEDFYDEHPQKLAIQMLAEKRKQLMIQTNLNPVNGMPFMDSSRPSTPLLLDEAMKEQKGKTKKRRRNHKTSARSPQKQLPATPIQMNPYALQKQAQHLVQPAAVIQQFQPSPILQSQIASAFTPNESTAYGIPVINPSSVNAPIPNCDININQSNLGQPVTPSTPISSFNANLMPENPSISAISHQNIRLSTSSCSDADNSLKRSKRRRIPNKFYGYTSDDDNVPTASNYQNPFKPTPPPNLTWSKEDLPKPSKNSRTALLKNFMRMTKTGNISKRKVPMKAKLKAANTKNRVMTKLKGKIKAAPTPTVPKIIIRGIPRPPAVPQQQQKEMLSDLSKPVHAAPVHHISPPKMTQDSDQSSNDSDSDSDVSNDGRLEINLKPASSNKPNLASPWLRLQHNDNTSKSIPQKSQQQQQQQLPFVRPVHTLLPAKRVSMTPSPPPVNPTSFMNQDTQLGATPMFNGRALDPLLINKPNQIRYPIRPPLGCRTQAREGESVYCFCRCPYDEVNEMIACDSQDCSIEWFHFECVGITVAPQDKWFCPQCRARNTPNNSSLMHQQSGTANHFNAAHAQLQNPLFKQT